VIPLRRTRAAARSADLVEIMVAVALTALLLAAGALADCNERQAPAPGPTAAAYP
jgi:hypothetical protein